MRTLSIDIETYSDVDLSKCGVYKYASSPAFEVLLFGYAVDGGDVRVVDLACGEQILSLIHISHLKVLQAAHISDDEYFSHMVLDDLNLIIRDIRETHKKDSESAPQTTVANELKENLEAVENFKGSRDEKLVVLYCKQLGINYKNLSDEEFRWLIRILKKSKKMGTPISQRKKR